MFKHLIALVLVALAATFVSPAIAQQPPGTSVGTLTCKMAPSIGLIFGSRQRMACRFAPNGPYPPEAYVGVIWAQLVSMSESRQVGSWRGAYLHPPQVRGVERLPAHMWGRAARLALAWALVPTFYSAERGVRSPCNRFLSRGRLGSTSLLESQSSRLPWHNEG